MDSRLVDLINKVIVIEGSRGKSRLAMEIGRGERMIDRYRFGQSEPSSDNAYKLALACGCSKRDAERLAHEHSAIRAKEPASA